MSYRVTNEVLERAEAEGSDRLVLLAVAEIAYHDGVGWLPQLWRHQDSLEQRRRSIQWRARLSERQVPRSVDALRSAQLDEIETRTAQDGRRRILIYRVIVGKLRELEVEYDRIPYRLDRPFSTPAELLLPWADRPANLAGGQLARAANGVVETVGAGANGRPASLAGGQTADDLPSDPRRPAIYDSDDLPSAPANARAGSSVLGPRPIPSNSSRGESARELVAAAAVEINDRLIALRASAKMRMRACAEPDRASAWLDLALAEADTNPAGYFRVGFDSGEWPSPRENPRSTETRHQWLEQTSWRLDADESHYIVDGWGDLDAVEKARLHERVDEIRADRAAHAIAEARTA